MWPYSKKLMRQMAYTGGIGQGTQRGFLYFYCTGGDVVEKKVVVEVVEEVVVVGVLVVVEEEEMVVVWLWMRR